MASAGRFCEQCGGPLKEGLPFCTACGAPVPEPTPAPASTPPSPPPARRVSTLKVFGSIAVVLLVVAGAIGAYLKLTDPDGDAVRAATGPAVGEVIKRGDYGSLMTAGFHNVPLGDLAAEDGGPVLKPSGNIVVQVDVRAVHGQHAVATATASYEAVVRETGGVDTQPGRAIGTTAPSHVSQKLLVGMRKTTGHWRIAWIYPAQRATITFARPASVAASAHADLGQATELAKQAVTTFATHEDGEDDTVWDAAQAPFYADDRPGHGAPELEAASDATGPLADVLRAAYLQSSTVTVADVKPSTVAGAAARPMTGVKPDALYQHVEVHGQLNIRGGQATDCANLSSQAQVYAPMTFAAELVRSRLSTRSLWYVRRLVVVVGSTDPGVAQSVAVPVAELGPGATDLTKYPETDAWAGAADDFDPASYVCDVNPSIY